MDWAGAIEVNRDALIAVVAAIFRMLGLEGAGTIQRIEPYLHRRALRLLRPAESAARRVIVMAARGLAVEPAPALRPRAHSKGGLGQNAKPRDAAVRPRPPAFQLYDPRKCFTERRTRQRSGSRVMPRIAVLGFDPRIPAAFRLSFPPAVSSAADASPPEDDGLINGVPLCRRLQALKAALADVPRQAQRLMRWRARRERDLATRPLFTLPLRPGVPPGYRDKPVREVDRVLVECHWLACDAMKLDTS
jgi:hypothetical protein